MNHPPTPPSSRADKGGNSPELLLQYGATHAEIRLNRPQKRNALTWQMFDDLPALAATALHAPASEGTVRALILTGSGGHFSAGLDVSLFAAALSDPDAFARQATEGVAPDGANRFQRPATLWRGLDLPVIAAVEGVCLGGGCQIALGADIRFAHPDSRWGLLETQWGLIPDMGVLLQLPRLMRLDQALSLVWSARIVDGHEAQRLGLVTHLSEDPLAAAQDYARSLAHQSPDAVRAAKQLLQRGWQLTGPDALAWEAALQSQLVGSRNQQEAVQARLAQRVPQFTAAAPNPDAA